MRCLILVLCSAGLAIGCDDAGGTLTYGGDCSALGQHISGLEGAEELDVSGVVESCQQNALTAEAGRELINAASIDDVTWSLGEEAQRVQFDRENDLLPDDWGQRR